jgi:hypothetical protein
MADVVEVKKRYSLDDLLRVTAEVPLERRGKRFKVYLRTLGVAADDARRVYATRKARLAHKALGVLDGIERQELLEPLAQAKPEELIDLIVAMKNSEFWRDARFEIVPLDAPEPPDDPTVVDVVKVEEAQDAIDADLHKERAAYVERRTQEYRETCAQRDVADLREEANQARVDAQTNAAFSDAYMDATLYWAVYRDPQYKKHFFAGPEDVGEVDSAVREALLREYYELDAFSQDGDGLKN